MLNENQDKFIRQRLDYLAEASKRMGKKDWMNLTLGVLMNLILFLRLTSNTAGELMKVAGNTLRWLTQNLIESEIYIN